MKTDSSSYQVTPVGKIVRHNINAACKLLDDEYYEIDVLFKREDFNTLNSQIEKGIIGYEKEASKIYDHSFNGRHENWIKEDTKDGVVVHFKIARLDKLNTKGPKENKVSIFDVDRDYIEDRNWPMLRENDSVKISYDPWHFSYPINCEDAIHTSGVILRLKAILITEQNTKYKNPAYFGF
ncbi:hypothetical protein A3715_15935 [Oleiphilus sp. HI0009]|nr:hypothetical protein A3715_15935 [Oleiphilus sp. HI0009]